MPNVTPPTYIQKEIISINSRVIVSKQLIVPDNNKAERPNAWRISQKNFSFCLMTSSSVGPWICTH